MDEATKRLRQELHHLRQEYVRQLPDKLAEIDQLWENIKRKNEAGSMIPLQLLAHGLAGSGTTFGFPALTESSRKLDISLRTLIDSQDRPTPDICQEIEPLIQAVIESVQPDEESQADALDLILAEQEKSPSAKIPSAERTLYILEDDPALAKLLVAQLGHFGYTAQVFEDTQSLSVAMGSSLPSAILADIVTPEGDLAGTQAIAALRCNLKSSVPILFASSRSDIKARLSAVRAAGIAYFTKPLDINAVVDKLDVLTMSRLREPYRVLVIDDSPLLASLYAHVLALAGMVAEVLTDPLELLDTLGDFRPELILLDMYMPGCTGDELALIIRQQEDYVSVPIVFLSVESEVEKQLKAMRVGGDDFLTKPIKPAHLVDAVSTRVERYRVLRSFMIRDSLTGLLNHTSTKQYLQTEVARARRSGAPLAYAMIDIDRFKSVNDRFGHPAGDRVIKSLARLLQQRLRKGDGIGRYGGEEFAVILPETTGDMAVKVFDQIRQAFSQVSQRADEEEYFVTFSCGISEFPAHDNELELNNAADKALYAAKREGRNRVFLAGRA